MILKTFTSLIRMIVTQVKTKYDYHSLNTQWIMVLLTSKGPKYVWAPKSSPLPPLRTALAWIMVYKVFKYFMNPLKVHTLKEIKFKSLVCVQNCLVRKFLCTQETFLSFFPANVPLGAYG